jgi:murein DD-endopeptidase MepM/ murein hydrolase activator NlpD
VTLRLEVVRARSGKVVRSWRERRAKPGRKLTRSWDGLTGRGRSAREGRYEFRVGPAGGQSRFAAGFRLRTHVFPVDGPHGTRGGIGEFGAPRSGGRVHEGFDITGSCGTPLVAARGGVVSKRGYDPQLYGHYLLIDGRKTAQDYFYSHLIAPAEARKGDRVHTGERVGRIGQTGNAASTPCHLHFEVRVRGRPVDPEPHLRDWDR